MNTQPNYILATGKSKGTQPGVSRRHFVVGASSALALTTFSPPLWAKQSPVNPAPTVLTGNRFDLSIGYQSVNFTGQESIATTVNGSLPAPILRWKEGDRVTLRVTNNLREMSSIHWHGMVLPSSMDGSPGFDFAGIKPGETFEYQFDVVQNGTYWYHSHSGFQEQTGLLGAIIIDPKEPDPVRYNRDLVVVLSDWTDKTPAQVYATLKKMSDYYNHRQRTFSDLWRDLSTKGLTGTWKERSMWNQMRMSQTDIADVTGCALNNLNGCAYTYLMNGTTPEQGWLGLFKPGEKVRLRFINGAAMSIFDVRIPGLKMTVVAADGQNVQPVVIDEFRIGVAETYDVIVEPDADKAYTLFAQTIDRTGFARGTLTSNPAMHAEVPAMDPAPLLGHGDMGMDMTAMDMAGMDHGAHDMSKMDEGKPSTPSSNDHDMSFMSGMDMSHMNHGDHDMSSMEDMDMSHMNHGDHDMSSHKMSDAENKPNSTPLAKAGFGSNFDHQGQVVHPKTEFGPHVDMRAMAPQSGLADPGIGLREHQQRYGRKVLTYADLCSLQPTRDKREPSREIELHLTGNMHRYMWSLNGIPFAEAKPLELKYGERVRVILVNDTMMTHPIHLHGMWSELETGDPNYIPRKHTVLVQPGSKISYLVTADAKGTWAYHCHLLYHMPGMMRKVTVA